MSGDFVEIRGLGRYVRIAAKYDYAKDKCRCPACGGLGMPWGGWFSCEDCEAVALVTGGDCFIPAPLSQHQPREINGSTNGD